MKLTVRPAKQEDIYKDIVRIPERFRLDTRGKEVIEGSVCKIVTPGGSSYGLLRGLGNSSEPVILMDERIRNVLCIGDGDDVEVSIKTVGHWGQFWWAWNASDPAYRVAARLGLLSVVLGFIGVLLGGISLGLSFWGSR